MKKRLNKKAVSVLIGYVLLVVFALVISGIVYAWLKTYVPSESLECSEGVSIFLKDISFDETSSQLSIVLVNNGRFNIAGYFIYASNSSSQGQPTIPLASYIISGGVNVSNSVWLDAEGGNHFEPADEETSIFNITDESNIGSISSVLVIPVRFQEDNDVERLVSCGDSRVLQSLSGVEEQEEEENSCDGIWEGVSEDPGVECDGGTDCVEEGEVNECTCPFEYGPDGFGGCEELLFVAFVTSTSQDGDLGGIEGGDSICQARADSVSSIISGTFVAWLSNDTLDAVDRIVDTKYYQSDQITVITNNIAELIDGDDLLNEIHKTEVGTGVSNQDVWTGTQSDGTADSENCGNWESDSFFDDGVEGNTEDGIAEGWTDNNDENCNRNNRLYCFQIA